MLPAFSAEFPGPLASLGPGAALVVPVNAVRVHLDHDNGTTAFDSAFTFVPGVDSITIAATLRLNPAAPPTGEPLALTLAYANAAGDTVFKGGPVTVTARPLLSGVGAPPESPRVALTYVGPGSRATSVRLSPHLVVIHQGDAFAFTTNTFDASGAPLAAPVVFTSLDVPDASLASPAAPAGVASAFRALVPVVGTLVGNGAADTAYVSIVPRPEGVAIISGNNQSCPVSGKLSQAVAVKVTDVNGDALPGAQVRFTPTGGGVAGNALVTTDASGIARTWWRLGAALGPQTLAAEAVGLSGIVATFTATATTGAGGDGASPGGGNGRRVLHVESGDGQTGVISTVLPAPIAVRVVDTAGSGIAGVKVDWKTSGSDGTLADATTTTDARGIASTSWTLGPKAGKMTATATVSATGSVDFTAVAVDKTQANVLGKLVFATQPTDVFVGNAITPAVVVEALDLSGHHDDTFKDAVTIVLGPTTTAARLGGSITVSAHKGLAVFDALVVDGVASGLTLGASTATYASATSNTFNVIKAPPAKMYAVSGGSQSAKTGATLASPLVVAVEDAHGKRVPGVIVAWATLDGRLSATTSVTDANGLASMTWTLGSTKGSQSVTAAVAGLSGSPVSFSATAKP